MSRPSSSLWKLTAMTLGIIALVMVLVWLITTWAMTHFFDEVGKAIIEDDLREYGVIYENRGAEAVTMLFDAGGHGEQDQGLRLIDSTGTPFVDRPIPIFPQTGWPEFPNKLSPGTDGIDWLRNSLGGGKVITIGRRRFEDGSEMWFARNNSGDLAAIEQVHELLFVAILIAITMAIGPTVWFASRVLRPVNSLIDGAHRLARGESLTARLETSVAIPELRIFAEVFNESLDRVQTLTEELEAANDQLAHELRTPLARIRGNVESILNSPEVTPAILENAARAVDEIVRSSAIIRDILSIRAGDSGTMRLNLELVSLNDLVRETFELYSASAEEKGLKFKLETPSEDDVGRFDRQRLQQALCNLLDNAISYTPAGGEVELLLEVTDSDTTIHVRDSGPGLAGDDDHRIWRRFMRGSIASASTPGIGLGLSLVRAVATAHHGEAGGANRAEGGADFWIRIPFESSLDGDSSR
jgi:signal transduction histidine kinase